MWRLYIVPLARLSLNNEREIVAPMYFWSRLRTGLVGLENIKLAWKRYAWENHCIVAADVTDLQHSLISAQVDVIAVPEDLDSPISDAIVRIRDYLEDGHTPGKWLTTHTTYRQLIRTVLNMWSFANRYASKGGRMSSHGIGTTWDQLPSDARQKLRMTADEFRVSRSKLTSNVSVGQLLKDIAVNGEPHKLGEIII